ncbi:hypothetical protein C2G38_2026650 [Gigaspora rosea]|uniref:SAP domain-containing protein n=1 Tax=Gigaspora rosea TaxID=44941 RepID=A0A397WA49_9GLOM|nr:hypothetical protein C2G38_2026650 [Gigaspora rosea]
MSVEMLKFLCHKIGASEADSKQDLVSHLVDEIRKRNVLIGSDNLGKGKAVDVDSEWREIPVQDSKLGFEFGKAFPNIFNNTPANSGNSKAKGSYNRAMPRTLFLVPVCLQVGICRKAYRKNVN